MKRILLFLLILTLVLPVLTGVGYAADEKEVRPYVLLNWSAVDTEKFDNVHSMFYLYSSSIKDGKLVVSWRTVKEVDELVQVVKAEMDGRVEGMRWLNFAASSSYALKTLAKDVLFMEDGVEVCKAWLEEFLSKYKAAGGKLDGLMLDFEYFDAEFWYLNEKYYSGGTNNTQIYNQIVENPMYAEKLRPMLAERGFKFYPTEGGASEIYSIYPGSGEEYGASRRIWDACTRNLISQYLNEAVYEPVLKYYPEASVNDYTTRDMRAWFKEVDEGGAAMYLGGNRVKVGNSSNNNTYSYAPVLTYESAGGDDYTYKKMPGYNKAIYEDDPYNMAMWDVNLCKYMYASTPEEKITMWFAFYYYCAERPGSTSHSPYYAEAIFHMGLLDPYPFFGFIVPRHNDRLTTTEEYEQAVGVSSEILHELTRVVGASDRKPIQTPANWNNGYLLSGMTAGGRAYWRITPDTTDGMTLEEFKISREGESPKFSINGQTILFPGGKIIEDGEIPEIGTCGYWIQTDMDTRPVISNIADRYAQYPSFSDTFEQYEAGTELNNALVRPEKVWEIWTMPGTASTVLEDPNRADNQVLAISGTTSLKNVRLPENITAGDSYALQQMWEVAVTLPEDMADEAEVRLFTIFSEAFADDGGMKIAGTKVFYDQSGAYQQMDTELKPGETYTFQRKLDFRGDTFTSSYYVYNAKGKLVGKAEDIPILKMALPISGIGITCNNVLGSPVLLDDYKLYPVGLTAQFEVYNAQTGILWENQTEAHPGESAYRLSWLNGSNTAEIATVMAAYYDKDGNLVADEPVKIVEMRPGWDGVVTGIVENRVEDLTVRLYLQTGPIQAEQTDRGESPVMYWAIFAIMGLLIVATVILLIKRRKYK